MQTIEQVIDNGRTIDWGKTSNDYAMHRPGPPQRLYDCLATFGVGLKGQRVLDLGTGTGVVARTLALRGAIVAGIDVSAEQIEAAKRIAQSEQVSVDFRVSPAETLPFPDASFDVVIANQCWMYFDKSKVIPEVARLLAPGGLLVTSHFTWLPRQDSIARATEQLVLKHNPDWTAADWSGEIPSCPSWSIGKLQIVGMFYFDVPVPFSRESWMGRVRASRGVSAALDEEAVRRFDEEHSKLLAEIADEKFDILHRIDAHIFRVP
jgi:2-polyprenyl-3-methyl-5-hydroxy-6-metoxy-1,4-benzoquinol methylase